MKSWQRMKDSRESGFSLIELSIVMIVIGIIITTIARLAPTLILTSKDKANRAILTQYQNAIRGYLASHGRLPCPDTNDDGWEESTCANVGTVPFLTLGFGDSGNDAFNHLIRYGVFRGTNEDITATNQETLCGTLRRLADKGIGQPTDEVYVGNDSVIYSNIVYGLASAGRDNSFNGLNSGNRFAPADVFITNDYDDMTASESFNQIYSMLNCGINENRLKIIAASAISWSNTASPLIIADVFGGVRPYKWCAVSAVKPPNVTMDPDSWTTNEFCDPTTEGTNDWLQLTCSGICGTLQSPFYLKITVIDSREDSATSAIALTIP